MLLNDSTLNMASLYVFWLWLLHQRKATVPLTMEKTYSEPFVLWQNIINVFLGFVTTVQVKIISSQAEIHSGHHSSCFENKFTN